MTDYIGIGDYIAHRVDGVLSCDKCPHRKQATIGMTSVGWLQPHAAAVSYCGFNETELTPASMSAIVNNNGEIISTCPLVIDITAETGVYMRRTVKNLIQWAVLFLGTLTIFLNMVIIFRK
jgi:hypothetical protein